MLIIRREQMLALERDRRRSFERRLEEHLLRGLTARGIPVQAGGLRDGIRQGLAEAARYGFVSEADAAEFLEITCWFAGGFPHPDFPKQALAILHAYGLHARVKLDRYRRWAAGEAVRAG